jgi:hypothetical protein
MSFRQKPIIYISTRVYSIASLHLTAHMVRFPDRRESAAF